MGEYCYFQAGVAGQRAGVTVVTLGDNEHIRTPETVRTLAIHVLPKIWSPNGRRNIIEPLPADRPHPTHLLDETGCLHVYLYEREILKLPANWQQPFSAVVGSGNEPAESNRREDTPYVDLWNAPAWEPRRRFHHRTSHPPRQRRRIQPRTAVLAHPRTLPPGTG